MAYNLNMRSGSALITALAALALWPSPAGATWQGRPGKLAYWTLEGLNTIGHDGTHHRLFPKLQATYGLDWSRNGHELAFSNTSLWRMHADGRHRKLILSSNGIATVLEYPSWSPDGRTLVFTGETDSNNDENPVPSTFWIYTVRRDGTHLRKLVEGREAVWSKSGRHIRFAETDGDIAQIEPDGNAYKVLAHGDEFTFSLDLSPDGKRLVYETTPFSGNRFEATIHVLDVRTRVRVSFPLSQLRTLDVFWAPGGKRLAFIHSPNGPGRSELRTMRPDGHGIRRAFTFPARNSTPRNVAWQTR